MRLSRSLALLAIAVSAAGQAPAARASWCDDERNPQACRDWISGHQYEGYIVAATAAKRCQHFVSGAAPSVIATFERTSPDLTAKIKTTVDASFDQDPDKACRVAYEALGPLGYMTGWFGGALLHIREPAPPDDFMGGFQR